MHIQKFQKQLNNQNYTEQWSINFFQLNQVLRQKVGFCSLFPHDMFGCRQRSLWLSNIDEEQSEECCNGVLERVRSRLMNGAPSVFLSVSGSFQDDNLCSAQLPAPRSGFCGVFFFVFFFQLHSTHIFTHTLCLLSSHFAVLPPFSYHPPSLPARLGPRTSPAGWIRGRFPVAVGCNPEVQAEPRQSPP